MTMIKQFPPKEGVQHGSIIAAFQHGRSEVSKN